MATPEPPSLDKLVAALRQIRPIDRSRFARSQLQEQAPDVVRFLDQIPRAHISKAVLYIANPPHSREPRLAAAARQAGWFPYLLSQGMPKYSLEPGFLASLVVPNLLFQIYTMWLFPGPLVHLFALRGDESHLHVSLKHQPLILDCYDTATGMRNAPKGSAQIERSDFESADALTHRDLRIRYLEKRNGYQLPQRNLFIHDPLLPAPVAMARNQDPLCIRVVSVGWVDEHDHSLEVTARALSEAGIHLHVFLNPHQAQNSPEVGHLTRLAAGNPYLHLEPPAFGDDYVKRLQQFDFGLAILEPYFVGKNPKGYTDDYLQGCGSSRLSDYIRLGLGVIISPQLRFQHFWARRYATSVVVADESFVKSPRVALESALDRKRPKDLSRITVGPHLSARLDKFYNSILKNRVAPKHQANLRK